MFFVSTSAWPMVVLSDEPSKLGGVDTGGHQNPLPSGKAHS